MHHTPTIPSFVIAGLLVGCTPTEKAEPDSRSEHTPTDTLPLAEFDGWSLKLDALSGEWRTVNDNIMGGRSSGGGEIRNGLMIFTGSTNTNGGGFSSVRASDVQWDLTGFDGLAARVRADGRRYVFHIFTGLNYNNGNVFYRGMFETDPLVNADSDSVPESGGWQEVFVAFRDFVPMVRGRAITGRTEQLDPSNIRSIGLMIDDGLDGPFRLEVDWIRAETRTSPS